MPVISLLLFLYYRHGKMFKSLNFEWHFQFFQCYSHGCVAMWTFSTWMLHKTELWFYNLEYIQCTLIFLPGKVWYMLTAILLYCNCSVNLNIISICPYIYIGIYRFDLCWTSICYEDNHYTGKTSTFPMSHAT